MEVARKTPMKRRFGKKQEQWQFLAHFQKIKEILAHFLKIWRIFANFEHFWRIFGTKAHKSLIYLGRIYRFEIMLASLICATCFSTIFAPSAQNCATVQVTSCNVRMSVHQYPYYSIKYRFRGVVVITSA